MKYQISCVGEHSYHVEDFEFEGRPEIGMEIISEDSTGDKYIIRSESCVPFGVPTYTAIKIEEEARESTYRMQHITICCNTCKYSGPSATTILEKDEILCAVLPKSKVVNINGICNLHPKYKGSCYNE